MIDFIYANPKEIKAIYAYYRREDENYVYREAITKKVPKYKLLPFIKKTIEIPAGFGNKGDVDDGYRYNMDWIYSYTSDVSCYMIENNKVYMKAYISINIGDNISNITKFYDSDEEMKKDLANLLTSITEANSYPFVKII